MPLKQTCSIFHFLSHTVDIRRLLFRPKNFRSFSLILIRSLRFFGKAFMLFRSKSPVNLSCIPSPNVLLKGKYIFVALQLINILYVVRKRWIFPVFTFRMYTTPYVVCVCMGMQRPIWSHLIGVALGTLPRSHGTIPGGTFCIPQNKIRKTNWHNDLSL